jgi:hypothetical protein
MILFRNTLAQGQDYEPRNNTIFYPVLALLVISLSLTFMLFLGLSQKLVPITMIAAAILFVLAALGFLGPHQIGAIIILVAAIGLPIRSGIFKSGVSW